MRYQYKKNKDGGYDILINWGRPQNHRNQRLIIIGTCAGFFLLMILIRITT